MFHIMIEDKHIKEVYEGLNREMNDKLNEYKKREHSVNEKIQKLFEKKIETQKVKCKDAYLWLEQHSQIENSVPLDWIDDQKSEREKTIKELQECSSKFNLNFQDEVI